MWKKYRATLGLHAEFTSADLPVECQTLVSPTMQATEQSSAPRNSTVLIDNQNGPPTAGAAFSLSAHDPIDTNVTFSFEDAGPATDRDEAAGASLSILAGTLLGVSDDGVQGVRVWHQNIDGASLTYSLAEFKGHSTRTAGGGQLALDGIGQVEYQDFSAPGISQIGNYNATSLGPTAIMTSQQLNDGLTFSSSALAAFANFGPVCPLPESTNSLNALAGTEYGNAANSGLHINFFTDGATTLPQNAVNALLAAAQIFENAFTDNITINIAVGWGEVGGSQYYYPITGGTGGAEGNVTSQYIPVSYTTLVNRLATDARSVDDVTAVNNLLNTTDPTHGGRFKYPSPRQGLWVFTLAATMPLTLGSDLTFPLMAGSGASIRARTRRKVMLISLALPHMRLVMRSVGLLGWVTLLHSITRLFPVIHHWIFSATPRRANTIRMVCQTRIISRIISLSITATRSRRIQSPYSIFNKVDLATTLAIGPIKGIWLRLMILLAITIKAFRSPSPKLISGRWTSSALTWRQPTTPLARPSRVSSLPHRE